MCSCCERAFSKVSQQKKGVWKEMKTKIISTFGVENNENVLECYRFA